MDPSDLVHIEVEQFTGEMALEVKITVKASEIETHAAGSNITWVAKGIRVVVPSTALAMIHEALARLVPEDVATPAASGDAT